MRFPLLNRNRIICTPRKPFTKTGSNDRLCFFISRDDKAKFLRGKEWEATVTDIDTGKRYTLRSADCAIPHCHCDAIVLMEHT